jgi:5-methylcytosine-specific restriction endonuclease McrA
MGNPDAEKPRRHPMTPLRRVDPYRYNRPEKPAKRSGASIITLDRYFSKYIRTRDTEPDFSGGRFGNCFTCGKFLSFSDLECGHYIGRQHYATRWEPKNCRIQCVSCNHFNEGEKGTFRKRLVEQLGEEEVARMEALRRTGKKPREWEAKAILERIKEDLRGLEKK